MKLLLTFVSVIHLGFIMVYGKGKAVLEEKSAGVKSLGSEAWLPDFNIWVCHSPAMGKLLKISVPQFPHLQKGCDYCIYLLGLNTLVYVKNWKHCFAHCNNLVIDNDSSNYYKVLFQMSKCLNVIFLMSRTITIGLPYFCDHIKMATVIVIIIAAHVSWHLTLWLGVALSVFLASMHTVLQQPCEVGFIIFPVL